MFRDRVDAGAQLAEKLGRYRGSSDAVVLGIPRGGLVVAAEAARRLRLPLDVVLTKKIGHPLQPEYAIGVVDLEGEVLDEDVVRRDGIDAAYLRAEIEKIRAVLRGREALYRQGRPPLPISGKTALVVDDGVATGNTIVAAIRLLRRRGAARIVAAVPVASRGSLEALASLADETVSVLVPEELFAIGEFYDDFGQLDDAEALSLWRSALC